MATQTTDTAEEKRQGDATDRPALGQRVRRTVSQRASDGTLATLAGGLLLANAARTVDQQRVRAGVSAILGGVLVGAGLRRRRAGDGTEPTGTGESHEVSAEAGAHLDRADVLGQSETNPRGVSDEPEVEAQSDPHAGDVQYDAEQEVDEAEPRPDLDGDTDGDPRLHDEEGSLPDDDHVEVDLSDASLADEASEAAGPADEQSYPAREGTDPEPTSEKAPERHAEGAVGNTDVDAENESDTGRADASEEDGEPGAESTSPDESADEE